MKAVSSNKSEAKFKSANGRITKTKDMGNIAERMTKSKSISRADKEKSEVEMTPLFSKCMSKSTSTPNTVARKSNAINHDRSKFVVPSPCRILLSPILLDEDNVRYGENRNILLPTKSISSKVGEENKPKKSLTKRRTVGTRRLFSVAENEDGENSPRNSIGRQLKVRLCRSPSNSINQAKGNVSKNVLREISKVQGNKLQENSLIKNLRSDWSDSTLCNTLLTTPQSQSVSKKQPRLRIKRLLTPLVEEKSEESIVTNKSKSNKKICEDENYSSSAEFESDDDKENCRLKKAPNWKDLHTKVKDSTNIDSSRISLRRSRRLSRLMDFSIDNRSEDDDNPVQDNILIENNNCLETGRASPENGEIATRGNSAQVAEEMDRSPVKQSNVSACTSKPTVSEEGEEYTAKCRRDLPSKSNLPAGVRLPRLRLRRFRFDSEKKQHALQSTESLSIGNPAEVKNSSYSRITEKLPNDPQTQKELPAIDISPLRNQEPKSNALEDISNENVPLHSHVNEALPSSPTYDDVEDNTLHSHVNEPLPNSPTYDDVEDDTSALSKCTSKKFFSSRVFPTPAVSKATETRKSKTLRKRKKKDDNIYEFLSQSSTDDIDPVADIIQKMISTGKVTVAKHNKRTGRLVIPKKKRKKENVAKINRNIFAKPKPIEKTQQPQHPQQPQHSQKPYQHHQPQHPQQKRPDIASNVLSDDDESHFDDNSVDHFEHVDHTRERGSFSDLARSTMIKQAKRSGTTPQRQMITDRKKLLAMAQKFVSQSTPVKSSTEAKNTAQFSPICGNKSPWRVEDDNLPSTFYFSRNSDNLPSYSSDYIPMTQNEAKSVSSFSSNDSDMENIAPTSVQGNMQIQTPSIQRGPRNRSPLKSINIIEVVNLPPLAFDHTAKDISQKNNQNDSTRSSASRSNKTVQNETTANKTVRDEICADKTDLFGFEDIIDEEDDSTEANLGITAIHTKGDLKEKLQRLKRLRPEILPTSAPKPESIKPVFDGPRLRQKSLRQMLCSTMIEKPGHNVQETRKEQHDEFFNDGCDEDLSNLFKDPEPETTFNESDSRRTYSRLYKTKRRKVRNNFVMFMDSDASEEEDEDVYEKKAKKRQKNAPKTNNKELNKFVDEFNEMCKEVSQYQLIVE